MSTVQGVFIVLQKSRSAAQVCFANLDIIGKLGCFTLHFNGAGFQNVGTVGNLQCHLRVLFNQKNRYAVSVHFPDNFEDFLDQQG